MTVEGTVGGVEEDRRRGSLHHGRHTGDVVDVGVCEPDGPECQSFGLEAPQEQLGLFTRVDQNCVTRLGIAENETVLLEDPVGGSAPRGFLFEVLQRGRPRGESGALRRSTKSSRS